MTFDGILITKETLDNYITQQHIARYIFTVNYMKDKIVLDTACGSGYGSYYLAEKGAQKVYDVDLDEKPLAIAKEFYNHSKVTFLQGNVLKLPFPDDFFDVVVSFETIEHLYEIEQYIKEIKRMLKKDATFICSTPNIRYTAHPAYHVHEFHPEEFYSLLEDNFEKVEKYSQYITFPQRLNDIFRLKARMFAAGLRILNTIPKGNLLKQKIKQILHRKVSLKKIKDSFVIEKNKVVPLGMNGGLLRIMIGVCKK